MFDFFSDIKLFFQELFKFTLNLLHLHFSYIDKKKDVFVTKLYRQRGRQSKRLIHYGMCLLAIIGILIGPYIAKEFPGRTVNPWSITNPPEVLSASNDFSNISTNISNNREGVIEYVVQEGDTISSIADKFGVSSDTVIWANKLTGDSIDIGDSLKIPPVTGIAHVVQKGDTIESISKKYGLPSAEAIVEFPFNTFTNDETFALAIGQTVIVPNGVMPQAGSGQARAIAVQITPNAGSIAGSGSLVWPTQGIITQSYYWYHPGLDIANPAAPNVLAADAGRIVAVGWDSSGYGNRVIIDHGNGMQTLYAHMSAFYVSLGQGVKRGDPIGRMGSTGHSSGTHLHFEVIRGGIHLNPFNFLQ